MVTKKRQSEAVAASIIDNPSHKDLRQFTAQMENSHTTVYGNYDVFTRVDSRSTSSTYIITDNPEEHRGHQTMSREEYAKIVAMQEDYMAGKEMIVIDGYISNAPEVQVAARLTIEKDNSNVAGMQKFLYFPREGGEPQVQVIYTGSLMAPGYPNDRCITVDLENNITRVLGSDYFGESKKGGLRMWNKIVYDKGGLPMHAGAKLVETSTGPKTIVIIGLSGTGKTTSTFRKQGKDSKPVQDDFIALMPGGVVHGTENGCFAKTFALSADHEPEIYGAVTSPIAYLENVYMDQDGNLDFFNESFTQNGRAVFPLEALGRYADARDLPPVSAIVILNRARAVVPALAKLSQQEAAAYFQLGETQGTSAGGKDEAGKALRVPGTNPFFPLPHDLQGNRFLKLLRTHPIDVYLMNTGWIVDDQGPNSKKITVAHSTHCLNAIAEGGIQWTEDLDFGYQVAESIPGLAPEDYDILQPRKAFERLGLLDDYNAWVKKLHHERRECLKTFPDLDPYILDGI